jgi:methionyl-tRNA formyltransferase
MNNLRIIFFGTPSFAVGILDAIINYNFEVVAVVTVADKPAGRGQQLRFSAVKEFATAKNLPILQPTNLKDEVFLEKLKSFQANVQIVVAFRMLPQAVWQMPEFGTFNLHASLLPDYRGAAPINWAIINGDVKTGVTTFFIDDKIDTGEIIISKKTDITTTETAGDLHDKLMVLGAETVIETLKLIKQGNVQTTVQSQQDDCRTANKLFKENCKIDWEKFGLSIYNHVRGLNPYPLAWTNIIDGDKRFSIKIERVVFQNERHELQVGSVITDKKTIKIAVVDGFIIVERLQFPGKKMMEASALLHGISFSNAAITD